MAENPFGLHIAEAADRTALLGFVLPIYHEDSAQTVSVAKVTRLVERCLERDGAIAGLMIGTEGIEASVGMTIDTFDYTDEPHGMVRWFGVAPAFRTSDRAARLMSFTRWLYDSLASQSDTPVPLFIPTLTTTRQKSKVRLFQRRAPTVGALFAFGCLPDRSFIVSRAGKEWTGYQESAKETRLVAPAPSARDRHADDGADHGAERGA